MGILVAGVGRDWTRRINSWRGRYCRRVGDLKICLVRRGEGKCGVVLRSEV